MIASTCTIIEVTCDPVDDPEVNEPPGGGGGGGGTPGGSPDPCAPSQPNMPCVNQPGSPTGCAPGGGGGGFDPLDPEEPNPCEQADNLENDSSFINKMQSLKSDANTKDYETGYFMIKNEDGDYYYNYIEGEAGGASIDISNTLFIVAGVMHSHYEGLFSTFSGSDVRAIHQLYQKANIANLNTFTMGVVTAEGTSYLMKIANEQSFLNFAQTNLANDTVFEDFELYYNNWFTSYKNIFHKSDKEARKLALLKAVEGSGIEIFEGNGNFTNWQAIDIENNHTITINCN